MGAFEGRAGEFRLSREESALIRWSFRTPQGHYPTWRASQLSGVPTRTLNDWAANEVLTPDYEGEQERWSYRDLVFARLVAWLRGKRMPRPEVSERVTEIRRSLLERADFTSVRSDGRGLFLGDEEADHRTGQVAIPSVVALLDEFNLAVAVEAKEELGRSRLWGPNLVRPTPRSYISPRVMGGEPCVEDSRIPTATLYALHTERGLPAPAIRELYPEVPLEDVQDALGLEARLRRSKLIAA